ncbi:MAG: hypothetical protein ACYC8T_13295, partial [Myxococcaceae bacterium]
LRPTDAEALEAAGRRLETAWRWGELTELLEARLGHAVRDEERAVLLSRIGAVREDALADAEGARSAFRRVLELRPDDPAALLRLDHLCEALGRFSELAEILTRRLRGEAEDRIGLQLRLAAIRRARLDDAAGALPLLGEVLQAHPGHGGALAELELLVESEPGFGPANELLLAGFRQLGDLAKLTSFIESRAGLASESERRRTLWLELSKIRLERQNDPELGFLALARAFRESPADATLRARLVELAASAGTTDALAAVLEEVLPGLDAASTAETSLTLAELYEGTLEDPDRAVGFFRGALEADPSCSPRALSGLDRVLEAQARWTELLPVLEARHGAARDPAGRIALLVRIASVAGERLHRDDRAGQALRDVLELEPGHLGAARGLEALYERTAQAGPLLGILEHLLRHVPARERQQVRLKLAGLCGDARAERAMALCREVLADDPLHTAGFTLLVGHLERAGRHDDLGQLLRARRAVTLDPAELTGLEFGLGELSYRRLGQPAPAVAHYREVLDRAPRHLGALEALTEIYEALGQKRELAQALGELAAVREAPADRRRELVRRAEVLVELKARDLALAAAREALELTPDGEGELERLRALLVAIDAAPEIARALGALAEARVRGGQVPLAVKALFELAAINERLADASAGAEALEKILVLAPAERAAFDQARALYARTGSFPSTAALLARFLPHLPPGERPAVLDELAEIHEALLDDPEEAFGWASQAVQQDPSPKPRRERVERLAKSLAKPGELATVYREVLERKGFFPACEPVSLALAALQDEQLDDAEAAERTLNGLLAHDPTNNPALEALVRMLGRRGLHAKQAAALEQKLEATTAPEARAALLRELAELQETRLADPAAAAHSLRRLLELRKDSPSAALLASLHRRQKQWPEALDALLRMRKLAPNPAERATVQLEMAGIYETQLADLEAAVTGYLQALDYQPSSTEAFRALERLYVKLERPAELLRAYEQRLSQTSDVEEQVGLLFASADLWEKRGAPQQADRSLERILQLRPREVRAIERLEKLRRAGERWKALSEVLIRHVEVAGTPAQKAELCASLGEVHHGPLRDDDGAARWWQHALELVPTHRPSLHALVELNQAQSHWLEAARLLTREAELETGLPARAELEHQAAVLREEKLKDLAGATAGYHRALAAHATHLPSLRRLRVLHHRAGDWPGYEQTLRQEAENAPGAPDRASAALELARHLETRARDNAGAVKWYELALKNRPEAVEAALPLSDLLCGSGEWRRAAEVLQLATPVLEKAGKPKRLELLRRLCQLAHAHRQLGRSILALETYQRALALEPGEPTALRGSAEVLEEAGRAREAAEQYALLLGQHERSLKGPEQVELLVRLAGLYRGIGAADRALPLVERALELDAISAPALRLAVELCDGAGALEKALLYRQRLAGAVTGDDRYRLLVEVGALAQDKLASPTRAIHGYVKALELHPGAIEVLERLYAAYRDAGQPKKAAETLEALLAQRDLADEARRRHTLALADLLGRALREEDRALAVLERALDAAPEFLEALQLLEALLGKSRRWKVLDECYGRMIRRLEGRPHAIASQAVLWRTLGELRRKRLEDAPAALQAYEAGARLAPDDPEAQEAFADAAAEVPERESDAAAAYVRSLAGTAAPVRVCAALAKLAEKRRDHDSAYLAAEAAAAAGTAGPYEERLLRELGKFAHAPAQLRSPLSDTHWEKWLLHPTLRGPIGDLMTLLWEQAGAKYAASLGDLRLHPKKHRIELRESREPSLETLRVASRALGFEALNIYSPFLASQPSGKTERHPDEAIALRVNPTAPPSLFLGESFLRNSHLTELSAFVGSTLALMRPELSMAVLLPPDRLSVVVEAALSFAEGVYVPRAPPKLLKADQKLLGKAFTANGRVAITSLAKTLQRAGEGDLVGRYLRGVQHTVARAALLVAGDFAAVQARVLPSQGKSAAPALRELLAFAVGGDLHALRKETGAQLVVR